MSDKNEETLIGLMEDKIANRSVTEQFTALGFTPENEDMTFREAMLAGQMANAIKGDKDAFRLLFKLCEGEEESPLERFTRESREYSEIKKTVKNTDSKIKNKGESGAKKQTEGNA